MYIVPQLLLTHSNVNDIQLQTLLSVPNQLWFYVYECSDYFFIILCFNRVCTCVHRLRFVNCVINQWFNDWLIVFVRNHFLAAAMTTAIGDGICYFAKVAFSKRFRRHLWTDLYEILTHDVYRSEIEHYEEIFGSRSQKMWGPKLPILDYFVFKDF